MSAKSIQAPIGGINSFDSLDDMSEDEAVILDNWIPDSGFCRMRGGSSEFVDTAGVDVGTLVAFEYTGGDEFVCCVDGDIYEISTGVPVSIGTGFTIPRWQTVVFGEKLLLVNGVDDPQQWDGTALADIVWTSGVPTPTALVGVNVYQGRVFYWENASPIIYYAAAGSYAGVMESFDLSFIAKKGGIVVSVFTWSLDAGDGLDDFIVFLMSTGEAIVYQGTDPSDINSWVLVGKYKMGEPISTRGTVSIAGDEIILTTSGWQSFHHIIQEGTYSEAGVTRKMFGLSRTAALNYSNNINWDTVFFPAGAYILINIPVSDGKVYTQHLLNTNTGAWSTLSNWVSNTFGVFDNQLFFGSQDGKVYFADQGVSDSGDEIFTDALPAYNYLSGRANTKQLTGTRIISTSSEPSKIGLVGTADYAVPPAPPTEPSTKAPSLTPWGSPWGSPWESETAPAASGVWKGTTANGYAISYRMSIGSNYETVRWLSTQQMFKDSGII